jgi:HPt (histidine-containing phosphotransfer) domain-containing protein
MSEDAFDRDELLEELDGDWEFLEESVEMLKEDAGGLLAQIRSGLAAGDADAVWQSAHTIKSMVGNFAAGPAFATAYAIETCGRENDLSGLASRVEALDRELQQLTVELEALLADARD